MANASWRRVAWNCVTSAKAALHVREQHGDERALEGTGHLELAQRVDRPQPRDVATEIALYDRGASVQNLLPVGRMMGREMHDGEGDA